MVLSNIEYIFDQTTGKWIERSNIFKCDISINLILDAPEGKISSQKSLRPGDNTRTLENLEERIQHAKKELAEVIKNNEQMKKAIADHKNRMRDLEEIVSEIVFIVF